MPKQLLTTPQLISHLKRKGITFKYISEDEAADFLDNHNYFFKLYAYRANYQKIKSGKNAGKYFSLDFAYLKELSIIDYHLRILILNMTLNLEHSIKVMLIKDIEDNPAEDGYNLANVWNTLPPNFPAWIKSELKNIESHARTSYCQNIIQKYHGHDYPIWAVCELVSFGALCKLIKTYDQLYPHRLPFNTKLLVHIRDIRNAAAHNNCLINDLTPHRYAFNLASQGNIIMQEVAKIPGISKRTRTQRLSNKPIYDFTVLLYLYSKVVRSPEIKRKTRHALYDLFLHRMRRHDAYFKNNATIMTTYRFMIYLIRYFSLTK